MTILESYAGEIAAFGAVFCWTLGSQTIEAASKRVGSQSVNLLRLVVSVVVLTTYLFITQGEVLPCDFPEDAWGWLALSGFLGLFLGDMCLFAAFVEIGPRLTMLIMCLTAPLSAFIDWIFRHEIYSNMQWIGMLLTILGVAWVILERPPAKNKLGQKKFRTLSVKGVLLALGGVIGQSFGSVVGKHGMGQLSYMQATQIRLIAALVAFIVLFTILGWWSRIVLAIKFKTSMVYITFSGIVGTTLGIGLSMKAFQLTSMGNATTIISTVPIFLIPFAIFLHKEHVSPKNVLATFLAFAGIYLMVNGG